MAGDERWRGFNFALGEVEGGQRINVSGGDGQASSFLGFNAEGPERWGDAHRVARMEDVKIRRLDGVLSVITGIFPLSSEFDKLRVIEFDFVFMRHDVSNEVRVRTETQGA